MNETMNVVRTCLAGTMAFVLGWIILLLVLGFCFCIFIVSLPKGALKRSNYEVVIDFYVTIMGKLIKRINSIIPSFHEE